MLLIFTDRFNTVIVSSSDVILFKLMKQKSVEIFLRTQSVSQRKHNTPPLQSSAG
jgi:hypothetical protein